MDIVPYSAINNPDRHQCFVIFDPSASRVHPADILFQGDKVREIYNQFMLQLISKNQTIKEKILHNRLSKIGNMLDLLQSYENVVIAKFFDRIWRRYSYISHLGENFLDLNTFVQYFPEYKANCSDLMALRYDEEDGEFDEVEVGVVLPQAAADDLSAE